MAATDHRSDDGGDRSVDEGPVRPGSIDRAGQWHRAFQASLSAEAFWPPTHDPGPGILGDERTARFLADDGEEGEVEIASTRNPGSRASIGPTDGFVELTVDNPALAGTLILPLDDTKFDDQTRHELTMVRWNPTSRTLQPVEPSGRGAGHYVWGRISVPGKYGILALPADLRDRTTIFLLDGARPLAASLAVNDREALHHGICDSVFAGVEGDRALAAAHKRQRRLSTPFDLPEFGLLPPQPLSTDAWQRTAVQSVTDDRGVHRVGEITAISSGGGEPRRIYVGTAWGGLWRLDGTPDQPGRVSWTPLSGEAGGPHHVAAVAAATGDGQPVYAVDTDDRVFRSNDHGSTWAETAKHRFGVVRRILVHREYPDRLYIAASAQRGSDGGGLWLSTDGGRAWELALEGDIVDAALGLSPGHLVLAAVRDVGILRSTTGGGNWERTLPFVSAAVHGGSGMALAVGPPGDEGGETVVVAFGQEMFVNGAGGRGPRSLPSGSWRSLGRSPSLLGGGDSVLSIDPFDASSVLAGGDELQRNANFPARGASVWSSVRAERPRCVEFDSTEPGLVLVATERALLCSSDHGATWQDIGGGCGVQDLLRVVVSGETAIADTAGGETVYSSDVRTGSFSVIDEAAPHAVVADVRRPGTFYLLGDRLGRLRITGGGDVERDDEWGDVRACSAAPGGVDAVSLLVGTEDRVLRLLSDYDDEPTWDDPGEGWSDAPIAQIAVSAAAPRAAVALSATGGVYRAEKTDLRRWDAWEGVGQDGPVDAVSFVVNQLAPERMYAIAGGAVWRSLDSGASWSALGQDGDPYPLADGRGVLLTHPRNGRVLLAGSAVGVFISTDEGDSWRTYAQGLPAAPLSGLSWADRHLVTSVAGSGLWRRAVRL